MILKSPAVPATPARRCWRQSGRIRCSWSGPASSENRCGPVTGTPAAGRKTECPSRAGSGRQSSQTAARRCLADRQCQSAGRSPPERLPSHSTATLTAPGRGGGWPASRRTPARRVPSSGQPIRSHSHQVPGPAEGRATPAAHRDHWHRASGKAADAIAAAQTQPVPRARVSVRRPGSSRPGQ